MKIDLRDGKERQQMTLRGPDGKALRDAQWVWSKDPALGGKSLEVLPLRDYVYGGGMAAQEIYCGPTVEISSIIAMTAPTQPGRYIGSLVVY